MDTTHQAIAQTFRRESGRVLATLIRVLGEFDRAEEALQDALLIALETWPRDGIPSNPPAWITTTARRRAIDRIRRDQTWSAKAALIGSEPREPSPRPDDDAPEIGDDQLRLLFTCCHPALSLDAQVALTLRTLCGLTTDEIARAFLLPRTTLQQRLVRAKNKIRDAGIPYVVPAPEVLPERLDGVLHAIYLVFNEGYSASAGDALVRHELCAEAIRLATLLHALLPERGRVMGLLGLMLLHDARRPARVGLSGELVPLEEQDRSLWDRDQIARGLALVPRALRSPPVGAFAIQAAIAALHVEAPTAAHTDWAQIAALYAELERRYPTPVVALNRAAAIAMARGPEQGLALLDDLAEPLDGYHLLHAARADLLRRAGRPGEARVAYDRALALTHNDAEIAYLQRRRAEVGG